MSRPKIYTWGPWRFEPHEYRLARTGEQLTLAMKSLDLLALLVSRAPRLVTKEDILGAVWPDAAVEEGNIAFHVAALRKVLDDDEVESCIETVRGRGYRFVASVTATPVIIPSSTQSLDLPPEVKAMPLPGERSWGRLAALTIAGIIVAAGIGFAVFKATRPAPILITTFVIDEAAAPGDDFATSVTQFVVSALRASGVSVITADGTKGATPPAAASSLGADLLLTGNMTLTEEPRWNVSLRLIRASDGRAVWAWMFTTPHNEHRRELQEQIAQRAADGVKSYLSLSGTAPDTR